MEKETVRKNPFTFLGFGYIERSIILGVVLIGYTAIGLLNGHFEALLFSAVIFQLWGFLLIGYAAPRVGQYEIDNKVKL